MSRIVISALSTHRPQGLLALGLVLMLSLLVFNEAVHSVHHLTEPNEAAACLVASASLQIPAAPAALVTFECPIVLVAGRWTEIQATDRSLFALRAEQERAPPSNSA